MKNYGGQSVSTLCEVEINSGVQVFFSVVNQWSNLTIFYVHLLTESDIADFYEQKR